MQNLNAAMKACIALGIDENDFYQSIQSFKGAARRLELIAENSDSRVYKDFAHSPSKLKATIAAVKNQFQNKKLLACMELHTFSSLNKNFLTEYKDSMKDADVAIVYYNTHVIEHKRLENITEEEVKVAFGRSDIHIFTSTEKLQDYLKSFDYKGFNLLLMSSGNFDGVNVDQFAQELLSE